MNKYIFRERKPKLPFRIEKQIPCNVFPLVFVFFWWVCFPHAVFECLQTRSFGAINRWSSFGFNRVMLIYSS